MPETISINNGSIDHQYTFGGEKIKKTGADGERYYIGGIEYNENGLEFISIPNGRVFKGEQYQYNLTDHLGNVVVMFEDANGDGVIQIEEETNGNPDLEPEVLQRNHYYSFGMRVESPGLINNGEVKNKYLYNGKELADDYGLNWHYYGFRSYDAAIGRFPSIDPIADNFAFVSGYNYAENSPIGNIDLWGLQKKSINYDDYEQTYSAYSSARPVVTDKAPLWLNNYKRMKSEGMDAYASLYREFAIKGGLGLIVTAQINNGQYPRLSGLEAWSTDAGGGTESWQNGIGGNLQRFAYNGISMPLTAAVLGPKYPVDFAVELGGNLLFAGKIDGDMIDMATGPIPNSFWYLKLYLQSAYDYNMDGSSLFSGTKSNEEIQIEVAAFGLGQLAKFGAGELGQYTQKLGYDVLGKDFMPDNYLLGLGERLDRLGRAMDKYKDGFGTAVQEKLEADGKERAGF